MNPTHLLLDFAARRWPADIRDEQRKEWEAEMHALGHRASTSPLLRSLHGLRFAFSLAASPPAEDENGVPRGWRELLPEYGRRLAPTLILVVATLLAAAIGGVLPGFVYMLSDGIDVDPYGNTYQTDATTWAVGATVVLMAVGLAVAGAYTGSRVGLRSASKTLGVVTATLLVLAVTSPAWPTILRQDERPLRLLDLLALAAWGVGMVIVISAARRFLRKGPWAAIAVAALSLIVLDLVAMIYATPYLNGGYVSRGYDELIATPAADASHGPLWFPLALLSTDLGVSRDLADDGIASALHGWMCVLGAVTAFTTAYLLRSKNPARRAAATETTAAAAKARPLHALRWTAGALGAVAFGTWAWTLGMATGDGESAPSWALDVRLGAIVATVLAGVVVLSGRGRPLLTAGFAALSLLVVDLTLDRFGVNGPAGVVQAAGAGAIALVIAWRLAKIVLPGRTEATARPLTVAALLAPFCVTGPFASTDLPYDVSLAEYPVPVVVVSVVLTILSGVAALGARERRTTAVRAVAELATRTVLVTTALTYTAGLGFGMVTGVVLAAWTLAVIRWNGRVRSLARWAAVLVGALVAGIPLVVLGVTVGRPIGVMVHLAAGYTGEFNGRMMLPGMLLFGALIAGAVASFGQEGPQREPALR